MRGIEFQYAGAPYASLIKDLLKGIDLTTYDVNVPYSEIYSADNANPVGSHRSSMPLTDILNEVHPYFVIHLELFAYPFNSPKVQIETYEDFLKSNCSFIILIADSRYIEIYVKSETLLMRFTKNAVAVGGNSITIKTEDNDGRTRMSV